MTPEEIAGELKFQTQTLARIETKVDKTNGRVTTLELWKAKITGAWFVASLAGPVITAVVVKFV